MNRARTMSVFLIAILAGGGLALGTYSYLQNAQASMKAAPLPTRRVVVANADLALGRALKAEDLLTLDWPENSVPAGSFDDPASIVDRGLIVSVVKNEPILPGKLASKEAGAGLPPIIPPGKRAVSVRVNEVIGVAGYVLPGTRVDVVATANPSNRAEDVTTKVVLSNVEVLAAGTRLEQEGDEGKPMAVTVVTMLVTPEESEKLTLAATEGKIQLALRNPLDSGTPATPGVRTGMLLGTVLARPALVRRATPAGQPAQPVMAPPPTVEIIKGDKRAQVVVG
jgi:pilus assembly protein CpaB